MTAQHLADPDGPPSSGASSSLDRRASSGVFAQGTVLDFQKYHGAGNDFVMLDGRQALCRGRTSPPWPEWNQAQVSLLCDRHFGLGADGLIVLQAPMEADTAFHMAYYNADGCLSSFCGNGARCATAFARALGVFAEGSVRFSASDGLHQAAVLSDGRVRLAMGSVDGIRRDGEAYVLDTGSPHWVHFLEAPDHPQAGVSDLMAMDLLAFARQVRYGEAYATEGINVNAVLELDGNLHMRTYERGVENETLSCGTGVTAAALAYAQRQNTEGAGCVHVHTRGGELDVDFRNAKGTFTEVHLIGPAERVFEGRFTA